MKEINKLSSQEIEAFITHYFEQLICEGRLTAIENQKFLELYKEWIVRQSFDIASNEVFFQVNKKLNDYAIVDKYGNQYNISIDKGLFNCTAEVSTFAKALVFAGHTIQFAYQSMEAEKQALLENKKPTRKRLVLGKTKIKFVTRDEIKVPNFVERFTQMLEEEKFIENQPWDIAPEYAKEIIEIVSNLTTDDYVREYLEVLHNEVKKVAYAEYCLQYKVKQNVAEDKKSAKKFDEVVPCFGM